jgi:hypothetical protein
MRLIGLAVILAVSLTLAPLAAKAQTGKKASTSGSTFGLPPAM